MYRYEIERIEREREKREKYLFEKVPNNKKGPDKRFVSLMTSMSHTYGNVLAWFQNYMLSIMPEDTFKTIHVNSKIAHRQIRSTNHEFLKKSKPMIIFRPRISDMNESRFLKGTPLVEKQNDLYSTWGKTELQPFLEDHKHDLVVKYQQNRSVMYVDVIMIFSTLMTQIDFVHYLENAIVWDSDSFIFTCLESYLPQEMLKIISDLVGIPLYDQNHSTKDFLQFMNQNCISPITYKLEGSSGNREFYRYYGSNINLIFQDLNWNDGEKIGHVMDSYQINFTARIEFYSTGFYYIFSDKIFDIKLPRIKYTENDKVIPIFTDILTKEDLNLQPGWHLFNRAMCRLDKPKDIVNIKEMFNQSILQSIKYHRENGLPLIEFLDIRIRRQGKLLREGIHYHINYDTFDVSFENEDTFYTYNIIICTNVEYINNMIKILFKLQ